MTRLLFLFAALAAFATASFAQAVPPRPTPTPNDDVVRISTDLIQIDVTATDAKGNVVKDLKPNEIEIYENGQKQQITNFSFVSALSSKDKSVTVDKAGVPVPTTILRPEQIRRTFALVVDDLSLSFESAYQTRRALRKFVDEQMETGDLVAIIRTGAGMGALQQFTSDKRLLYAAIEKVNWNPQGTGGVSAFAPIEAKPEADSTPDPSGETEDTSGTSSGTGQSLESFRGAVFATGTLGALRYIVTGMSELPGRKSVILFSDGFKLEEKDEEGNVVESRILDFLTQLVDLANRSSVTFYTMDPRGLQTLGFTAADNISDTSQAAMDAERQARSDQLHDTQEGLQFLAQETGGTALINNNDLAGGIRRVLEDQSYYLVGYDPGDGTFDPAKRKFNSLTIKVTRPGVKVRYRSGFFNVADKDGPTLTVSPEKALSPLAQLQNALISPFAVTGIGLRLNALFAQDAKQGAYVRSLLHIDARDLKWTDEKDGAKKASFEVIAMSFGDNGRVIDQIAKTYTMQAKGDELKKLMAEGFVYHFAFPVKKPGPYQYRVAIRDSTGGAIGSASQFIEVPDLKKSGLTLSSIVVQSVDTADQLKAVMSGPAEASKAMTDTALRRIRSGSVLKYGYEIYNAKLGLDKQPQLRTRMRVFRDGKVVFDGKERPFTLRGQTDMQHLTMAGAFSVGKDLEPGDYILQVIVTDPLAGAKRQVASQFVQFEVVE